MVEQDTRFFTFSPSTHNRFARVLEYPILAFSFGFDQAVLLFSFAIMYDWAALLWLPLFLYDGSTAFG